MRKKKDGKLRGRLTQRSKKFTRGGRGRKGAPDLGQCPKEKKRARLSIPYTRGRGRKVNPAYGKKGSNFSNKKEKEDVSSHLFWGKKKTYSSLVVLGKGGKSKDT